MATYVLVHGGGHGGWCYQRLGRLLRSAGNVVYAPTLTGLGERSHLLSGEVDLSTHTTDILNVLHYEDLTEVILVGHSYGGMVITAVADRAVDRVGRLVYLDAATPKNGQSCLDFSDGTLEAARSLGRVVDGVELFLYPDSEVVKLYGVSEPNEVRWMMARLTPHPWKCFEQPLRLSNEESLSRIPKYHIVCESTLGNRDPEIIAKARADGRLWTIDAGHDLMITEPQTVAEALLEVASR